MNNYIFVVSAPSGAGKTSLLRAFLNTDLGKEKFTVATSHTTRQAREGEINGVDYHFINQCKFKEMVENKQFIEYAQVFTNYYGTSKVEIDKLLKLGKNIILEIDWQGAKQARNIYKEKCKSLFILPPSLEELEQRLKQRSTDSDEVINYRMKMAINEIKHANEYDENLVNNDFEKALKELKNYFLKNLL